MSGGFDMHIHSAASDGKLSPSEIMSIAINIGLDGFAITDHDTVAALMEAQTVAMENDFPFIPGIEISAEYERQDIHILGYWIDYRYLTDSGFLVKVQEAREKRFWRITKRLQALGMPLDAEKIMASLPPGSS